jgi:hypothetical protein
MLFMADTNILLRFISPSDPNHILVRDANFSLRRDVALQRLYATSLL